MEEIEKILIEKNIKISIIAIDEENEALTMKDITELYITHKINYIFKHKSTVRAKC